MAQGNYSIVFHANTINFVSFSSLLINIKITYVAVACGLPPLKDKTWCIRLVVRGNKLDCEYDSSSSATDVLETKILFNSVIFALAEGARFMILDLKDISLMTRIAIPKYIRVSFKYFPEVIQQQYNLYDLVQNSYVYIKIKKGMYGLKQAAMLD